MHAYTCVTLRKCRVIVSVHFGSIIPTLQKHISGNPDTSALSDIYESSFVYKAAEFLLVIHD